MTCKPETEAPALSVAGPLRRRVAATEYLKQKYGIGPSPATLATMATRGGGPEIVYFGRIPLYSEAGLDSWALGRLSAPVRNTSERRDRLVAA